MARTETYYRGYRIVVTQGVWMRYFEITPTRPEIPLLHPLRIVFLGSETEALSDVHRRVDELLE
jgi:hypothetical protein